MQILRACTRCRWPSSARAPRRLQDRVRAGNPPVARHSETSATNRPAAHIQADAAARRAYLAPLTFRPRPPGPRTANAESPEPPCLPRDSCDPATGRPIPCSRSTEFVLYPYRQTPSRQGVRCRWAAPPPNGRAAPLAGTTAAWAFRAPHRARGRRTELKRAEPQQR